MPRMKKTSVEATGEISAGTAKISFEDALSRLEEIVKSLEAGDLPLDQALAQFSQGVSLSQICLTQLDVAEKAMDKILREEQGSFTESPLNLEEG